VRAVGSDQCSRFDSVLDQDRRLEVLDSWLDTVDLGDADAPGVGIECLGVLAGVEDVEAAE
jgi:hypothetical protein